MTERHLRLTASTVGSISKMQRKTKRAKKVETLLYSKFKGSDATRYGSLMEEPARQDYIKFQQLNGHPGLTTKRCGLVVSKENPWLAASPDNKVLDPTTTPDIGLVEYKYPNTQQEILPSLRHA